MRIRRPYYVWSGRFQPFHNGHLFTLQRLLEQAEALNVAIGVLSFAEIPTEPHGPGDAREGDANNPLTAWHRRQMIEALVRAHAWADRVSVHCVPRTDIYWPIASDMLPPERIICFARRPVVDNFEEAKIDRYKSLGERVDVIDVSDGPNMSGTRVRAALASGRDINGLLPEPIFNYLRDHDLIDHMLQNIRSLS